jgi:DNA-binding beta-propeller fold protein YncE
VADASSYEVVAAVPMNFAPLDGYYVESRDKLYCSDEESGLIAVINCATDSLERRIFTPGSDFGSPVYSSGSNKLYYDAYLNNGSGLVVIDCAGDSLKTALPVQRDMTPIMVYNPAMDRIYWCGMSEDTTLLVVDCAGDSVVGRVLVGGYPAALACNPDSNRAYCASYRGDSMFVSAIDCAADSVMGAVFVRSDYYHSPMVMCYVSSRDVVCCRTGDSIVLVDGAATQVVGYARPGGSPSKLHFDRVSDKLYCLLAGSDELAAIDCRDMSLEARIRLAARLSDMAFDSIADRMWVTSPDYGCMSLVDGRTNRFLGLLEAGDSPGDITWAPPHRKMYVVDQEGHAILVLRDTSLADVYENPLPLQVRTLPTVVRGVLVLGAVGSRQNIGHRAELLDATGREVMDLVPGANDVRALSPGVYFVREPASGERSAVSVRKVVITR